MITKLIQIKPDDLIELGMRMKQQAMEGAYPGETVLIDLVPGITLTYRPESEFCKPLTRVGAVMIQGEVDALGPN